MTLFEPEPPPPAPPAFGKHVYFTVYGVPVPQGSKVPVRNRVGSVIGMRESNDVRLRPWRQDMANGVYVIAEKHGQLTGPVKLEAQFRFPGPASVPKRVKALGWRFKQSAPDTDKLLRALGDALQAGGLLGNDAQLADVHATKLEVWESWTGVHVELKEITA